MPSPVPANAPRLVPAGDAALLVVLGETIDPSLNARVHALAAALDGQPGIVDLAPAYASLLVIYDPATLDYPGVGARVYAALASSPRPSVARRRAGELPVASAASMAPICPPSPSA